MDIFENMQDTSSLNICKIKVIGVGGAGNNAVNRMIELNIGSAKFATVNTDKQALMLSKVEPENRIAIGESLTKGLGAGSDPEVGEKAAEESREQLEKLVDDVDLLFIAAGMGGGTGTGAAPVIAKIAKEKGCVTVAVVTKPFAFEGRRREENARKGIANLSKYVDTIIIIPNDKLLEALPSDTSMLEALRVADDNLRQGICGIADLISKPALINLDFADVRTIIKNQGLAHMGVGKAKGENRVVEAVRQAISSPLLETTIEGARGVILNVTGGKDLSLGHVYEAAHLVQGVVDSSANIIFGADIVQDDFLEEIKITVIATGFVGKDNSGNTRTQVLNQTKEQTQPRTPNTTQTYQSSNQGIPNAQMPSPSAVDLNARQQHGQYQTPNSELKQEQQHSAQNVEQSSGINGANIHNGYNVNEELQNTHDNSHEQDYDSLDYKQVENPSNRTEEKKNLPSYFSRIFKKK